MAGRWIQKAVSKMESRGTVGSLTRIAKSHGKTPKEYCSAQKKRGWDSKKIQRKCQFMANVSK